MSVNKSLRAFLAIEFSEKTRTQIANLAKRLVVDEGIKLTIANPKVFHLTMKFLGDLLRSDIEQIVRNMGKMTHNCKPFEMELGTVGVFPGYRNPTTFWIGLAGGSRPLHILHKQIDDVLEILGYDRDSRIFTPHITLARISNRIPKLERQRIANVLLSRTIDMEVPIEVNSISLMESSRQYGSRHYITLAHVPFGLV